MRHKNTKTMDDNKHSVKIHQIVHVFFLHSSAHICSSLHSSPMAATQCLSLPTSLIDQSKRNNSMVSFQGKQPRCIKGKQLRITVFQRQQNNNHCTANRKFRGPEDLKSCCLRHCEQTREKGKWVGQNNVHRKSLIAAFEPNTDTSCSSYSSIFLFIMSIHGPNKRSKAWTSNTGKEKNNT